MKTFMRTASLLAIASTAIVSCNTPESVAPVDHSTMHLSTAASSRSEQAVASAGLLNSVKAQTSRFNAMKQAEKAGYVEASPCVAIPIGGMGFHYVNFSIYDDRFDPMNPEALVYAPDEAGKHKLVALEYIVLNTGQARPSFGSQPFDINGTPDPRPHWSLHVWLFKDNPTGIFMPWNPDVSCPTPETE
jgi:hypothetical protein